MPSDTIARNLRAILFDAVKSHGNFAGGFVVVSTDGSGGAYYTDGSHPQLAADERKIALRNLSLQQLQRMADHYLLAHCGFHPTPTPTQIRALSEAAAAAGDLYMVASCNRALWGDAAAMLDVASVLADAAAMQDEDE